MTTSIYSACFDGGAFRVVVQDGCVDCSEVPDIRTWPWALAHEWLIAQGFKVRRIDSGSECIVLEFDSKRTQVHS